MSQLAFSRRALPTALSFSSDTTITGNNSGTDLNIQLASGGTLDIKSSAGSRLWAISNGSQYFSSPLANAVIARDSDTGTIYFCGGSSNNASSGAVIAAAGNNTSASSLSLNSGTASSSFVQIDSKSAVSPTIRFLLTSTEQWRINSAGLQSMVAGNTFIYRNNGDASLLLCGAGGASSALGSFIEISGIAGGANAGAITFTTANTSTASIFHLVTNASARHRFYVGGVEHIAFRDGVVFASTRAANELTAAGVPLLGANCPATTLSAPYQWLKIKTSDGSDCYIPAWK
jgi:hypothetical protein